MIIAVEAVTIVLFVVVLRELLMRWGPRALRGVATGGEAERLLGRSRLRRVRRIVRPDIVSAKPRTNRSGTNKPGSNRSGTDSPGINETGSNRRSR